MTVSVRSDAEKCIQKKNDLNIDIILDCTSSRHLAVSYTCKCNGVGRPGANNFNPN